MEFKEFNNRIQQRFADMCKTGMLFRAKAIGDEIWDLYLKSFEDEKIFRDPQSSEHNCNHCKNFIRRYGNVVAINPDCSITTMFDALGNTGDYLNSCNAIVELIKESGIRDVFFESYDTLNRLLNYESCNKKQDTFKLGIGQNFKTYTKEEAKLYGVVKAGEVYEFNHFFINLPKAHVIMSSGSVEAHQSIYRDKYSVFKRGMMEISLDTLNLVIDLINQGSLLDGTAHLETLRAFRNYKVIFNGFSLNQKDAWCWTTTYNMNESFAKFKNTLIGVLCTELSEGMELNKACENWNKRVDPANYHKATAPITQRQIEEAKKFTTENGYVASFSRRLATIDDIKASEIKHINAGDGTIEKVSVFDNVKSTSTRHKRSKFYKVETIAIDRFMTDVLPSCDSVEVFLENRHEDNLVVMTTSINEDSKPIFKWPNNYAWTFNGNLTGKSQIKQAVKDAGGNVEGVLNVRLAWNDGDGNDNSDLDIWAAEPKPGDHIGYNRGYRRDDGNRRTDMSGQLDVDNTNPKGKLAVENITWTSKSNMGDGVYKIWVNQFVARNSQGFKVEIEFDGETYLYEYNKPLYHNEIVKVAEVTLINGEFKIKHLLSEAGGTKELWNLDTSHFHKVNLVCLSPNHWKEKGVGNLHYFFMLDKCGTKDDIRGFHNEHLNSDLLRHRKVMEVLGATTMITPNGKHLAGLGFNSTVPDELIVRCKGTFNRVLKIKF